MAGTDNQTAAPATTAAEASARLTALTADSSWSQRYFSGDPAARRDFQQLTQMVAGADADAEAIAGKSSQPGLIEETTGVAHGDLVKAVSWLRENGLDAATVQQLLKGEPIPRDEYEAVVQMRSQLYSSKEWVAKLLAGDHQAKRDLTLISVALNAGAA
jgi:hypothetical protein